MNRILKTISLGTALAATAATALIATPAAAQPWHGGYNGGGYNRGAGVAVAAGVLGLAVGAALADQGPAYDEAVPVGYAPYAGPANCYQAYPGYDGACYPVEDFYRMGWAWHDGGWWNRVGQRFDHPFMGQYGHGAPHGAYAGGSMRGGFGGNGFRGGSFGGGHGGGHR